MIIESITKSLKIIKKIIWVVGGFLVFLIIIEILRAYQTLYFINPWLGYILLAVIFSACIWIIYKLFVILFTRDKIVDPPSISDWEVVSKKEVIIYNRYLLNICRRFTKNKNFDDGHKEFLIGEIKSFSVINRGNKSLDSLIDIKKTIEDDLITPSYNILKEKAETIIQKTVRDIIIAVIVSPLRSADIFWVVIRNLNMYNDISKLYNVRLHLGYTIRVLIDIVKIVATVNYLNLGEKLIEGLMSKVPLIGRSSDDIAQGIGAGILTNAVGTMTIRRITCLVVWDDESEKQTFKQEAVSFGTVVVRIYKDISPNVFKKAKDSWNNWGKLVKRKK